MAKINAQNDCTAAIVVCGNTGFAGLTATGVGTQELSDFNVCSSQENNSIWLKLSIDTAGTFAFVLHPESDDIQEDFDFWLFGPNVTCGAMGTSIRCSTTNPELSGAGDNLTGLSDFESDVSEGPGSDGNNYVQSLTVNAGDSYFLVIDRPIGFSNFSLEWTGTATFNQQPTLPTTSMNIVTCDSDLIDDGSTEFNLSLNDATIIASQVGVSVTYHTSQNDAITGNNAISDAVHFVNTSNPQTLYARITNTFTECFNVTDFSLTVNNTITISNDNYTLCDDGLDGNTANGKTDVNLTDVTNSLFAGQNITGLTIKYYSSSFNALHDIAALPSIYYNTTPNQEVIYVKAENGSGCFQIKDITLHILSQPAPINATLTQCDTDTIRDGLTLFNLNEAASLFTNNDPNRMVAFFESGNAVPLNLSYTNTSNPQLLSAQITDLTTGCINKSSLTLVVNVLAPQVVIIAPQCDTAENGTAVFDLNSSSLALTATQTAAFYENENDALLEQHQIANVSNYTNTNPYHATIYVRVEDSNRCAFISAIELIVNKLPQVLRVSDGYYVCSDLPQNYITINAGITAGLPSDYTYVWHHDGLLLPQTTYEIQVNAAGIYTVDVTALGCSVTRMITVTNSNNAIIKSIAVDDFTAEINTVTVNLNSQSVGNYVFNFDNINGPFQESNFFADVAPGVHDLYIKDLNACGTIGPFPVYVLGIPKFFTPNGDGYNDTWSIKGVNPKFNSTSTIYIFDRQGKLLKQITPAGPGWDGIYDKKPLPAEDYWYRITLDDGRTTKGHFSLKR